MSNLVKILYEVAALRADCHQLHRRLFSLSPRRLMKSIAERKRDISDWNDSELERLTHRVTVLRAELGELGEDDLAIRRALEIKAALDDYTRSLADTLTTLNEIYRHKRSAGASDDPDARLKNQALLVTYDDAVQHQQRLGARLNDLIANL